MNRLEQARLIRKLWAELVKCQNARDAERRKDAEQGSRTRQKAKQKPKGG